MRLRETQIEFVQAEQKAYAACYTVYTQADLFFRFNWCDRVQGVIESAAPGCAWFLQEGERRIGGIVMQGNRLTLPFMAAPFSDRERFWGIVLEHAARTADNRELHLSEVSEEDAEVLTRVYGATLRWSKRVMVRPTQVCRPDLQEGFAFYPLAREEITPIVDTVYAAHAAGYTGAVWGADKAEIREAVERRFRLFGQTDTLCMGNVVKHEASGELAGVCIAGIYPDSPDCFATVHQLSVWPAYQRQGIARAMLLHAIHEASARSPAITLGVLVGNPAEQLYRDVGFAPGPEYAELVWNG